MFQWFKTLFTSPSGGSLPQLEMIRDHLDNLPEVFTVEGYEIRTYRPGDEQAWCRIMEGNVGENWTVEKCRERLINDSRFSAENLFLITHNNTPVASVCAWSSTKTSSDTGVIHMVAALEAHRGKGLGHLLNTLVLHRLKDLGYKRAYLLTDDWRLAAVKTYLDAGFRPLNTHETHPERWEAVFNQLGIKK